MPSTRKNSVRLSPGGSLRLGLCCAFRRAPICFFTTTATSLLRLELADRREKISRLCLANAASLRAALEYCGQHGIGCFRVASQILPVKTHPQASYEIDEVPRAEEIIAAFRRCGDFAATNGIRTTFHPDQFVVLNSPRGEVVARSLEEIEYQAQVAEWIGADVINIHAGGGYGDKRSALDRMAKALERLSPAARRRLTVENDDKVYTPADLLPWCRSAGVPLVYDVHHHRCLPDGLSLEQATSAALETWGREPVFHISSPLAGWDGPGPERHHDFVTSDDFPDAWRNLAITVEVEAKAKELAVARLQKELARQPRKNGNRTA